MKNKFEKYLEQQISKYKRYTRIKCNEHMSVSDNDKQNKIISYLEYKKYEGIEFTLEHVLEKYKELQIKEPKK